jgi:threonine aldolase
MRAKDDTYAAVPPIAAFECEVAALLGKEAAVFATSGKTVQLAALRVHADVRRCPIVAAHPRSHIVEDENDAIGALWALRVARVGTLVDPFTRTELAAIREPLAAVVVELPLRRAGYRVPSWDELNGLAADAYARGAAFHLDGARLWETAPGYGRTVAEIAALADSVYVSFYKGLGGLAGAVLAGDADTVAAARTWIARAGATVGLMAPYVASARQRLRSQLHRMPEYYARAIELAALLRTVDGVTVSPDPPACNAFVVYLEGERDALSAARDRVRDERGLVLFESLSKTPHPRIWAFEVVVDRNRLAFDPEEVREAFEALRGHIVSRRVA